MNFTKEKEREFYLFTTEAENILINEYMPGAPGDYVKVYFYGLMYAQHQTEMCQEELARQLRLTEEEVDRAWTYWEEMHVVRKKRSGRPGILNYSIEFLSLRQMMYAADHGAHDAQAASGSERAEGEAGELENTELKALFSQIEQLAGKVLSAREAQEIYSWIQELGASPEIICFAWQYCLEKGKRNIKYIAKVVQQWSRQGFETEEDVRNFLDSLDQQYATQKRILQALGLNRGATEAEKELIDKWFNQMHFNMERVLEACGKTVSIANPNLRYVNKVLENWYQEATDEGRDVNKKVTVTQSVLNKYYEYLRKTEEREAQARKEKIYRDLPRIAQIDREIANLGSTISRNLLSGQGETIIRTSREKIERLEEERAVLLTENDFPIDYTEIHYSCEKCKDTGLTDDGQRCTCTKKRIEEAEVWQKTN